MLITWVDQTSKWKLENWKRLLSFHTFLQLVFHTLNCVPLKHRSCPLRYLPCLAFCFLSLPCCPPIYEWQEHTPLLLWPVTDTHLKLCCKILHVPGCESLTVDRSWSWVFACSAVAACFIVYSQKDTYTCTELFVKEAKGDRKMSKQNSVCRWGSWQHPHKLIHVATDMHLSLTGYSCYEGILTTHHFSKH